MGVISIEEAYKRFENDEKFLFEKINDPNMKAHFMPQFNWVNSVYFLYTFFIEKDVQKSKNYLYKIGMTNAYLQKIDIIDVFNVLKTFTFPILSDSSKLIERYLTYSKTEYYDAFTTHFAKGLQSILKDDMSALEKHIEGMRRRSKKGDAKLYTGIITAFEGFYNNDQEQIMIGIYKDLKNTPKQNPNSLDYQYINYEATAIAKLAWRKGMEIEIDSPLVPKELLPIKELEHYEGYEFFKELETLKDISLQ